MIKRLSLNNQTNDINDAYENVKESNPGKKLKIFIAFDDMIADMISDNNLKVDRVVDKKFTFIDWLFYNVITLSKYTKSHIYT